jgi:probable F420-dependent oxidoreductase
MSLGLGRAGIWTHSSRLSAGFATEVEQLGYGAIWIGGSPGGDLALVDQLLAATEHLIVATGIVNIWADDAVGIAAAFHRIDAGFPGRFLLGLGVGHPEAIAQYASPYAALVAYLDILDAEGVPATQRVLAALGPRVLRLSAKRAAGAHPYLVTPEHTNMAREVLGEGVLLAPEHKVVLQTDPARARAIGRPAVQTPYLGLINYTNNLRRLGYTDADLTDGGSDRLIDDLVAHGDLETIAARVQAHLDAGADHVALQFLTEPGGDLLDAARRLAPYVTA